MNRRNILYRYLQPKKVFIHLIIFVLVFSSNLTSAEDSVRYFSQHDPLWKGDLMGDGTMDRYGCLVSSLAMMMSNQDEGITPGKLNGFLKQNRGYVGGNSVVFAAVEAYPGTSLEFFTREIFTLEAMKRYLDRGYRVILGLPGDAHWVYVLGYQGDGSSLSHYTYHDPGRAGPNLRFETSKPPREMRVFRPNETP